MASGVGRDVCDPAPCKIDHVAFNKDGRINYGSYLEVRVLEAAFPERETFQWKDLQRDALLEVVAYAYQAQTERVSDNCHQVADSVYVICNVGEFVEAYVGDTPGAGFIKVGLINNLRNPSGKHDCQASEIPIHDYIRSNIQYKLTYALSNFHWVNRVYCACGWWC